MRNTILYWTLLLMSAIISYRISKLLKVRVAIFLVTYILLFFTCEFLDIICGFQTWSQKERTENCYNWFEHYWIKNYGANNEYDYSESIFDENFDKNAKKATEQKYELIFKELNLGPGKTLLDCGCGICHWIDFCKQRGVEVIGLTLSSEQQEKCTQKGIKALVRDYRVFNKDLVGKFDAISMLGSTEHITISSGFYQTRENSHNDYKNLFGVLKQYLKPRGKILLTVLVSNKQFEEWTNMDVVQSYFMDRHYGGYYSTTEIISKSILENNLKIVSTKDYTKDYHWISVIAPDHFGHWQIHWDEEPLDKITYFLRGLLLDPFLAHHWLYYGMDTWMWQFGGYQKTPLTDNQVKNAIANLKYFTIES